MDKSTLIINTIIESLKEKGFNDIMAVEPEGNFFKAADITLHGRKDKREDYRIVVIKRNQ